jgi:large subunit ribosomal protein L9
VKVILNTDVINLGEEGDVRDVADGYARNFLIPHKLAVPYNKQFLQQFEHKKEAIENRKEEKRKTALGLKEQLQAEELVFRMSASESGKLFGSVSAAMIAEELEKRGYGIERRRIEIPGDHIRSTGEFQAKVKLYGQEEVLIKVTVGPLED